MKNAEILHSLLKPVDSNNDNLWLEFQKTVDDTILWYPNAQADLSDLSYRFSGIISQYRSPCAFIHTSRLPLKTIFDFIINQVPININDVEYNLIECVELLTIDWDYASEIKYEFLRYHEAIIIACATNNKQILTKLQEIDPSNLITSVFKPKSFKDFIKIAKEPYFRLIGKVFLTKVSDSDKEKFILFPFYDDAIFQDFFIVKGGMKIAAIFNRPHQVIN